MYGSMYMNFQRSLKYLRMRGRRHHRWASGRKISLSPASSRAFDRTKIVLVELRDCKNAFRWDSCLQKSSSQGSERPKIFTAEGLLGPCICMDSNVTKVRIAWIRVYGFIKVTKVPQHRSLGTQCPELPLSLKYQLRSL